MPFAIEMVDDIFANGTHQTLERTLTKTLGEKNGTIILNDILAHNPTFSKDMTRLDVWDAVALELAKQGVLLHLDNHVSKAFWCCGENDGNGWFGESYFDVEKWIRGLAFMAKHVSSLISVDLRAALTADRQRKNGLHSLQSVFATSCASPRLQLLSLIHI